MAFTFTINGHTYTSDPANMAVPAGYRFEGYGYITALANLVQDIVAVAAAVLGYQINAAQSAADAADSALEAEDAATSAAASAAVAQSAAAFVDSSPIVKGSADNTKMMRIEVDGNVETGTTRIVSAPPEDGTMATQEHVAAVAPTVEDVWAMALAI